MMMFCEVLCTTDVGEVVEDAVKGSVLVFVGLGGLVGMVRCRGRVLLKLK